MGFINDSISVSGRGLRLLCVGLISLIVQSENFASDLEVIRIYEYKRGHKVLYDGKIYKANTRTHNKLLRKLEKMVAGNKDLKKQVGFISEKIQAQELLLISVEDNIIPSPNYIDDSVKLFTSNEPGYSKPCVLIYKKFFDLKKNHPTLAYGVLYYQLEHATYYFQQAQNYRFSREDPVESLFYTMDAHHRLGLFFSEARKWRTDKPTRYEQYLLDSFEGDSLRSFSGKFYQTDIDLLYSLCREVDSNHKIEKSIQYLVDVGKSLIKEDVLYNKEFPPDKYLYSVKLHTYIRYIPQLLFRLHYNKDPKIKYVWQFDMEDYPEVDRICKHIEVILAQYEEGLIHAAQWSEDLKLSIGGGEIESV